MCRSAPSPKSPASIRRSWKPRSRVFVELPPVQRSAIILKDVLGHSLEEVAATMGTTVGAVKAALSRGRHNIAADAHER